MPGGWRSTLGNVAIKPRAVSGQTLRPGTVSAAPPQVAGVEQKAGLLCSARAAPGRSFLIVGRPLVFRCLRGDFRSRRLDTGGKRCDLRAKSRDIALLMENDVAQLGICTLEKGDLGFELFESR